MAEQTPAQNPSHPPEPAEGEPVVHANAGAPKADGAVRVATVNVNGLRASHRKGMIGWFAGRGVDVLTLQEVRAPADIVASLIPQVVGPEWDEVHVVDAEAEAKGRAGVAIASRFPIEATRVGIGDADAYFDAAGRWIEADLRLPDGTLLTVVSAYVHTGGVDTPKQDDKYRFLTEMVRRLTELRAQGNPALVTGDLNVGHTELDIKNWKANRKKAGFLPEERAYFDRFFGELGWVDVARRLAGEVPGPYTWWSMRGKAFDNDAGWRIDYQMATPDLADRATGAVVDRAPTWGTRFSDHAPLVADYQF
ncbi:exodeoxyribonuclease III [Micrococcus sp.]|uniref:exodeoxyribonuclease III n=1 Tax=Micrococcus sp. TaxID=1271 RepID=UPI002A91E372|nr:exodeoxyribonuclease III [Micrococcus sp.]MDY6054495.1 exodeoxyribonuclease III [Micrococcus sp.]